MTGEILLSREYEVEELTVVRPLAELPRPVVGVFDVVARGRLGRGFVRRLTVVEGLTARSEPQFREFGWEGLVPAEVKATAAPGVAVTPNIARLSPTQRALLVEARGCAEMVCFRLVPGFMGAQHLVGATGGMWSTRPLRLITETICEVPGSLLIRLPEGIHDVTLTVTAAGGEDLQEIPSAGRSGGGVARFELVRITDTVAGGSRFLLHANYLGRRTAVATLHPRRLARGVEWDGPMGRLILVDAPELEGLVAGVYRCYEPWRPPIVVPVKDGLTPALPEDVLAAGSLRVLVRIEDPWLPQEWPSWPVGHRVGEDVFALPGVRVPLVGGSKLGNSLAGLTGLDVASDELHAIFAVYELARDLGEVGTVDVLRHGCVALLARDPEPEADPRVVTDPSML